MMYKGKHAFWYAQMPFGGDLITRAAHYDRDLGDAEMGSSFRQPKDNLEEVQDRDWRELAWRLRCEHYETFAELLRIMRARARRAAAIVAPPVAAKSSDSDADPDDKEESFL